MKHVFLCSSPYLLSIDFWIEGRKYVADNLKKKLNVAYHKKFCNFMKLRLIQILTDVSFHFHYLVFCSIWIFHVISKRSCLTPEPKCCVTKELESFLSSKSWMTWNFVSKETADFTLVEATQQRRCKSHLVNCLYRCKSHV